MQPRICSSFNGNPYITIVSCSSHTNANDETDIIIFNNKISSLVWRISKYNVLIIGGEINAQIRKKESNKFTKTRQTEMGNSKQIF